MFPKHMMLYPQYSLYPQSVSDVQVKSANIPVKYKLSLINGKKN